MDLEREKTEIPCPGGGRAIRNNLWRNSKEKLNEI
ncbi:MAG: hypothetical protein CM15mP65_04500 [Crocinitomicaceae bacterium]|nr:MAG: hypothetical protein CM15mP65_04500 [Crocinitomicaceae bacterium]